MPITKKTRQKSEPKLHVSFDIQTGEILSIGHQINLDYENYFATDDPIAVKILQGIFSNYDYKVIFDEDDNEKLILKFDDELFYNSNQLLLMSSKKMPDWNIRAILNINSNNIIFELNKETTLPDSPAKKAREIKFRELGYFSFYIIKKDDPDYLYESITVDSNKLFTDGYYETSINNLKDVISQENIGILTTCQLKNHYFKIVNDIDDDNLYLENKFNEIDRDLDDVHIELIQDGNKLIITSTNDIPIVYDGEINLYLATDTPDHYIDTIKIDTSSLRAGNNDFYEIDFDLHDIKFFYHPKTLKISKRKLK